MRSTYALSCAAVCGMLVSSAGAATIMQTQTFGPNTPNYLSSLTFDKFDDLGGTLTLQSVKVKMSMSVFGGSATVDNDGVDPASVTIEFGASGSISSGDVSLLDTLFQPVISDVNVFTAGNFNLAANDLDPTNQFDNDAGPDNATLNVVPDSDMDMGFIAPSLHPQYIGAGGTFDIDVQIDTLFNILGEGGVAGSFVPVTAEGNVMVIYDYIPTPGTLAIAGFAGIAAGRRRRRA